MCDVPTCIGARIIAQVSADLSDDQTGVGGDVGAYLSAEVITYFSAEPNMDGHATCSARAPRDAQGGKRPFAGLHRAAAAQLLWER